MFLQVRTARPSIVLNGADYFGQLAPYFLSLSYTDNCDGERADDLQLHLADRDRRFISDWMPDKGTSLQVSIIAERWFAPNAAGLSLDCGEFWIDNVDFELPQHTVSVKASSIPTDARIKGSEETRGWEKTTLQEIANQIAGENGMSVQWESEYNPRYTRVEQVSQSGLSFLRERAKDCKLSIKVARRKIIFFDESQYEQRAASFTLVYGDMPGGGGTCYRMSGGHFTTKLTDTTKKASVAHLSPDTGQLHNESFSAGEDMENNWEQKVNEDPDIDDDEQEAAEQLRRTRTLALPRRANEPMEDWSKEASGGSQRKAQAVVREANKDKEQATIEMSIGNPLVAAGQTFDLKGVGQFDGRWFIESATHNVGPIYTTKLSVRRCLEGY